MTRKLFLVCGILASVVYIARDLAALLSYPGYDFASQIISELSALGVPSRGVAGAMEYAYAALMLAFSVGVWSSAGERRGLLATAALLGAATMYGAVLPAWTAAWLFLTLAAMGFAAAELGRAFFWYTLGLAALSLIFGALTGLQGPNLAGNFPTPVIGITERVSIGALVLWVVMLALSLWAEPVKRETYVVGAGY